jgi:outer membrane protein assembly factor BamB
VYALDATDGHGRWRTKLPGLISAPPAAVNGNVYVACLGAGLYRERKASASGLDPEAVHRLRGERAGQVAWHHDGGGFVDGHLAVAGGTVFGTQAGRVVAVAADSGARRWTADVGGSPQQGVAVAGDTVYVGAHGAGVRAFSLSGGTFGGLGAGRREWGVDLPAAAGEGLAVANGTVVTVGEGGEGTASRVVALR